LITVVYGRNAKDKEHRRWCPTPLPTHYTRKQHDFLTFITRSSASGSHFQIHNTYFEAHKLYETIITYRLHEVQYFIESHVCSQSFKRFGKVVNVHCKQQRRQFEPCRTPKLSLKNGKRRNPFDARIAIQQQVPS